MTAQLERYCRYIGKSNRTDRLFGLECGCIVIVRGCKMFPPGTTVRSESVHVCCAQHKEEIAKLPLPFAPCMFDYYTAQTYSPREEGVPWQ